MEGKSKDRKKTNGNHVPAAKDPLSLDDSNGDSDVMIIENGSTIENGKNGKQTDSKKKAKSFHNSSKQKSRPVISSSNTKPTPKKRKAESQHDESPKKKPKTPKKFKGVENALADMFANENSPTHSDVSSTSNKKPKSNSSKKVANKSTKAKPSSKQNSNSKKKPRKKIFKKENMFDSPELPVIKKNNKKGQSTNQDGGIDKFRDPFVRIEGDPMSPIWTKVVNYPNDPLTPDQEQSKGKSDLKQKILASGYGYCSNQSKYSKNTMSLKYDTKNADETWRCVFCQMQSHYQGLGDLFGPYYIQNSDLSPVKPKTPKNVVPKTNTSGFDSSSKRKNMSISPEKNHKPIQNGIDKPDQTEVWFHEDCVCWMPGLSIVGHTLIGLETCIRDSKKEICFNCNRNGCTIGCVWRGCRETAHFICAKNSRWIIDDQNFKVFCQLHRK